MGKALLALVMSFDEGRLGGMGLPGGAAAAERGPPSLEIGRGATWGSTARRGRRASNGGRLG